MDLFRMDRKQIGALGERVAAGYLRRHGFLIVDQNVVRKLGELDLVARKDRVMHFVEVKSIACDELPGGEASADAYDPSANLHEAKVRKVARMGEWYMAEHELEDEWQVDGILVWLRREDGRALVRYLPQLV
jgi:putative endonuclease